MGVLRGATARKSMVALMDQGVVSAANFLTGLILGRMVSKDQFGLYLLGLTILTLAMNIQEFIILMPYTIFSPRRKGRELVRYTSGTLIHQIVLTVVVVLLLLAGVAATFLGLGPPGLGSVMEALALTGGFVLLRYYARNVCFASLEMGTALLLDGGVSVLQVTGIFLLAGLGSLSAAGAYWVIGAASAAGTAVWFVARRNGFSLREAQPWVDLRQNLSVGGWILGSGLLWTLGTSLYPWLLVRYHGTASAGVWAACLGITALLNPLFLGLQNSFAPRIAHTYSEGGCASLCRFSVHATLVFGLTVAPFCLVLLFFGGPLVAVVYGSQYAGNSLVVALLALNFLVSALTFSPSRALFTVGRADIDFKVNLLMLGSLLTFGIPLVRAFGLAGAAVGLLAGNAICLAFRYLAFIHYLRIPGRVPVHPVEVGVPRD